MAKILSSSVTSTAYKVTKTVTGIECDVCKKVIPANNRNRYFYVTTGHHDWGNDSIDSYQTRDICPQCAPKFIADYLKDCSDTGHVRLETQLVWSDKIYEVVDKPPVEGEITRQENDFYD